ncbi:MAG: Mpo1-like protein, partial [Candidatus Acidoferrales bacterium]
MAGRLERLWANYEEHHRTAGNKWCHLVGIPLIIVGLLGLLAVPVVRVGEFPVEAALLLVV